MSNGRHNYDGFHTWKDTIGCSAVLLAILLGTLSGVYVVYNEAALVAAFSLNTSA